MSGWHARQQAKILSLTLRILLVSGQISQQHLARAARIAAAEVRGQRQPWPADLARAEADRVPAHSPTTIASNYGGDA